MTTTSGDRGIEKTALQDGHDAFSPVSLSYDAVPPTIDRENEPMMAGSSRYSDGVLTPHNLLKKADYPCPFTSDDLKKQQIF